MLSPGQVSFLPLSAQPLHAPLWHHLSSMWNRASVHRWPINYKQFFQWGIFQVLSSQWLVSRLFAHKVSLASGRWELVLFPGREQKLPDFSLEKTFFFLLLVQKSWFWSSTIPFCSSVGKESVCNAGDPGSIPGLGRFPGEGNGNPLQYSCLENPMDREAWQAKVHRIAKRWTWLKWLST